MLAKTIVKHLSRSKWSLVKIQVETSNGQARWSEIARRLFSATNEGSARCGSMVQAHCPENSSARARACAPRMPRRCFPYLKRKPRPVSLARTCAMSRKYAKRCRDCARTRTRALPGTRSKDLPLGAARASERWAKWENTEVAHARARVGGFWTR